MEVLIQVCGASSTEIFSYFFYLPGAHNRLVDIFIQMVDFLTRLVDIFIQMVDFLEELVDFFGRLVDILNWRSQPGVRSLYFRDFQLLFLFTGCSQSLG
ncbi:hypothetical protein D1970_07235 [Mesobacillus zeae]|uniref:Uncharacterized protein n=1 Tax=Mesobacillus zeae TaxID=1917180 RepID=A0A398BA14_9BACI|nr:hypothetical protein D1970_07235 [Mesobacillus zeae]